MMRRLVVRSHHRVLTKSGTELRSAAAITAPPAVAASHVSSAPSFPRVRQHDCPRDASSVAVSRRAFASNSTAEAFEAEFVEKKDASPTGARDEIDAPPTTKTDWCGDAPDRATYGRIIDVARLVAEVAYSANEANVGALAEASGDEGAAERWLRGVLRLLEGRLLPAWWDAGHRDAVLRLAARRNLGYYAKRCVDVERLKVDLGREAFERLEDVALEVHTCVVMEHAMAEEEDDDEIRGTLAISKEAIDEAIQIWGEETANQLFKKTKEDIEEEQAHGKPFL